MRRWSTIVVALLGACDGTTAPSDSDTHTGTDTGSTSDTGTEPPDPVAQLDGTVMLDGVPLEDAFLKLCRITCYKAHTDATGQYFFLDVPPLNYSLEVVPDNGVATVFTAITLVADESRTINLVAYPYQNVSPITTTFEEHAVGTSLFLTLSESAIEPALLDPEPPDEVGGVRVPLEGWPPLDNVTGTVLGVWYLDPFDYLSVDPAGLPVRFENEWALAEGTELAVLVGSYTDSAWLPAGVATVGGDGTIHGAALPVIATVLLVQP